MLRKLLTVNLIAFLNALGDAEAEKIRLKCFQFLSVFVFQVQTHSEVFRDNLKELHRLPGIPDRV